MDSENQLLPKRSHVAVKKVGYWSKFHKIIWISCRVSTTPPFSRTSDLIISTRELDRKFRSNLNKINSAFEINTGLLKNRTKCIKYLISKLNKFNSVSYLCFGDFDTSETFFDEKLLRNERIKIEVKLGILPIVNLLNKKNQLLTNRNKNSSVSFFNYLDVKQILSIIERNDFEKLLIRTNKNSLMKKFLVKLEKTKNQGYHYYLFNETKKLSPKDLSIKKIWNRKPIYSNRKRWEDLNHFL